MSIIGSILVLSGVLSGPAQAHDVINPGDFPSIAPLGEVTADLLKRLGMNVDLQIMDMPALYRRRSNMAAPDAGGWNAYFIINDCLFTDSPATNAAIRGNAKAGSDGWPDSPALEALRQTWLDAHDLAAEKRIAAQLQLQMWRDVPYIPIWYQEVAMSLKSQYSYRFGTWYLYTPWAAGITKK